MVWSCWSVYARSLYRVLYSTMANTNCELPTCLLMKHIRIASMHPINRIYDAYVYRYSKRRIQNEQSERLNHMLSACWLTVSN